jgi:uncharacterized repeat protein (TIGR03803 family)
MDNAVINRTGSNNVFSATLGTFALTVAIMVALTIMVTQEAQAQTYTVIHNFAGGAQDGSHPYNGLTIRGTNLYGTTANGGASYGTVYQLAHPSTGWVFNLLYSFQGGNDGAYPTARVVAGPNGTFYGSTIEGGAADAGVVFNLKPPTNAICGTTPCAWTETPLYQFTGGTDGYGPTAGDLAFDQTGNIYGVTEFGGSSAHGNVYELTPSGGTWTANVLYSFGGGQDGEFPYSGVTFDQAGNLDGTTRQGGGTGCLSSVGCGTVFQLAQSDSGWTENILYRFQGGSDGGFPESGVILDPTGNIYGTTSIYGNLPCNGGFGCGVVFELMAMGGNWTFSSLYDFTTGGGGPVASLIRDAAGNLYGTTLLDGANRFGNVFELTPTDGGWTYTDLYDFTGGNDGGEPMSNIVLDAQGNLYGTTYQGGTNGLGVVFEITP